jgi:hypothetical protein
MYVAGALVLANSKRIRMQDMLFGLSTGLPTIVPHGTGAHLLTPNAGELVGLDKRR